MKKKYTIAATFIIFSLLFWCLPFTYEQNEFLQNLSSKTRDIFFKIRKITTSAPDQVKDIVIVAVDEESCQRLEARWPWSRNLFAKMVENLKKKGAKAVGLNFSFTGLEDGDDVSTKQLASVISKGREVVIGATFDSESRLIRPSPILTGAGAKSGYLEKIVDPDFVIRRSFLLRPFQIGGHDLMSEESREVDYIYENSFALQVLLSSYGKRFLIQPQTDRSSDELVIKTAVGPVYLSGDGSYSINYLAVTNDFVKIPAWKLILNQTRDVSVKGKIVLVGLTSSIFSDIHPTPYGMMPGVYIHANELVALLSGRMLRFVPDVIAFAISWLLALCILSLFLFRQLWLGIIGAVITAFGLFLGAEAVFLKDTILEPAILFYGPIMATLVGMLANWFLLFLDNKGLETEAIHDKMTGLFKYEYMRAQLEEEWKRSVRTFIPISIAMIDMDKFKKINDTLGHEVGNDMIKRAAQVIRESVRKYDLVSRYGGDEFVVLLRQTNAEEAKAYRQRLRNCYQAMACKLAEPLNKSTLSVGVATFDPSLNPKYPPNAQKLIEDADKDLFSDKMRDR